MDINYKHLKPLLQLLAEPDLVEQLGVFEHGDPGKDVHDMIKDSLRFTDCAFFLDGRFYAYSPWGWSQRHFLTKASNGSSPANFLTSHLEPDAASLRTLFTGIEFVIYKLSQILLAADPYDYAVDKIGVSRRFKSLQERGHLESIEPTLFRDIAETRNAFAHSFAEVSDLEYRGLELRGSFSDLDFERSNFEEQERPAHFFLPDTVMLTNQLIAEFQKVQIEQCERRKLNQHLKAFVKKGSSRSRAQTPRYLD